MDSINNTPASSVAALHESASVIINRQRTSTSLVCKVCDIELPGAEEYRKHAKSDSHIYKLRCRIAEPGTEVVDLSKVGGVEWPSSSSEYTDEEEDGEIGADDETLAEGQTQTRAEANGVSEDERAEFVPDQCLFCGIVSQSLEANEAHMAKNHSFLIPRRDSLQVGIETLIWYLRLVVYQYRECILCGSRRSTLEGVQQHMRGKGHCRFDVDGEMADFYEPGDPEASSSRDVGSLTRPDDESFRLASGKLVSHRSHVQQHQQQQTSRPVGARGDAPAVAAPSVPEPSSQDVRDETALDSAAMAVSRREDKTGALVVQLAQLSVKDQRGLAHLSVSEQRAVLASRRRGVAQEKRRERRMKSNMEKLNNRILMKHFRMDVPGPKLG